MVNKAVSFIETLLVLYSLEVVVVANAVLSFVIEILISHSPPVSLEEES